MQDEKWIIDAKALMRYIEENHSYSGLPMASFILTMELLTYAPRLNVAEVTHGKWIIDSTTNRYCCSECGGVRPYDVSADSIDFWKCDYCPDCGAKMALETLKEAT